MCANVWYHRSVSNNAVKIPFEEGTKSHFCEQKSYAPSYSCTLFIREAGYTVVIF